MSRIYLDLNGASIPSSKVFVEDLGADGLRAKRNENQPFDVYESAGKRTDFDATRAASGSLNKSI